MNIASLIRFGTGSFAGLLIGVGMVAGASEYDRTIEKDFQLSGMGKLIVQADRGSIEVNTGTRDNVHVRVLRHVKGGSQAQADELFANHEVTFKQDGNTVSVVGRNKKDRTGLGRIRPPNLEVRYEINLPRKFDADLKTAGGDIRLGELDGSAVTRTSSGSIDLGTISGRVESSNSGGDVHLGEIEGDVVAQTSSGSIKIATVKGKAEIKNSGGKIGVGAAGSSVVAETSSGSIEIANAKGKVEAKNSGGDVRIGQADAETLVRTSSGSIVIKLATGKVDARNSGGKIEVNEARDVVVAHTSSGPILVGLGTQPKADSHLEASGGDIKLTLPRSASVDLDAETSGGKVVTTMPISMTVTGVQKPGVLRGKINGGGPVLNLRASSGDIRLNESGASTE